jgi:5'-3' exonuclease
MKLLLDADIVCYRSAAASEQEDLGIAKYYVRNLIDEILANTGASEFSMFLTGDTNFRYQVYPEYKANRLDVPRPKHLPDLRQYVIEEFNAVVSDGCEADDLLGIEQCAAKPFTTTIVSIDKDLLMIPGNHFSWQIKGKSGGKEWIREAKFQTISDIEGLRWFYTQCLVGDISDNIKGCPGIGKVGAFKMLAGCETEQEMFDLVRGAYDNDAALLMNGQCLWIQREPQGIWKGLFGTEKTT